MENRTRLLEVAYQYLMKHKKASFSDIWKYVKKELDIPYQYEEKAIGNLYTGMILDTKFFLKSDKLWYPRNEISLEEIKSQVTSIANDSEEDEFDLSEEIPDETENFAEKEEETDDDIFIAEDSYDDGDVEDLNLDLNKRILQEEFQD